MKNSFPHQFIAIEGNIGAGKTTLCKMMAKDSDCRLILEQFTDNPFLPPFYENPERYALPVELFFMTERHKQLQEAFSHPDLFQKNGTLGKSALEKNALEKNALEKSVSDYFFIKTLLFARNNLNDEEYRLFQRLFNTLNGTFPKPDLLVYLHRSVADLQKNISNRGRNFEQEISDEYLLSVQKSYFNYFKSETQIPILILDIEDIDFWQNGNYYQRIMEVINQPHEKGMQQVKIEKETLV